MQNSVVLCCLGKMGKIIGKDAEVIGDLVWFSSFITLFIEKSFIVWGFESVTLF